MKLRLSDGDIGGVREEMEDRKGVQYNPSLR